MTAAIAPARGQQALPGLTEGVQYRFIEDGQPFQAQPPGRVEVAEVFAYTCPHCAHFSPMLDKWAKQLPAHARLVLVPGVFGRDDPWARLFFAAQTAKSLGVLHPRLFADPPAPAFSTNVVWNRAIAQERLTGARLDGVCLHVGSPQARDDAEAFLARLGRA